MPSSVVKTFSEKVSERKSMQSHSAPWQTTKHGYDLEWSNVQNVIIGSNSIATKAAMEKALELGYIPVALTNSLQGEAKDVAQMFVKFTQYMIQVFSSCGTKQANMKLMEAELEVIRCGISKLQLKQIEEAICQAGNSHKAVCIICGGETTVHVKGEGKGGRNQEMVLAYALEINKVLETKSLSMADYYVEFLSAGTDGQDGPTEAAGAVVNTDVIPQAKSSNLDPQRYLDNNDSNTLFNSLQQGSYLVQTGLTGTNVMDIQLLLVQPTN